MDITQSMTSYSMSMLSPGDPGEVHCHPGVLLSISHFFNCFLKAVNLLSLVRHSGDRSKGDNSNSAAGPDICSLASGVLREFPSQL